MKKKNEKGQVIVENLFCILLVCLIFFGVMQLFFMFIADSVISYSSFVSTRSRSVGYKDYLTVRTAEVATIPAAGKRILPDELSNSYTNSYGFRILINEYFSNQRKLKYEYWGGDNQDNENIAPFKENRKTSLKMIHESGTSSIKTKVIFRDYPLALPMRLINFNIEYTDIEGEAVFPNYAKKFLDLD